MEELDRILRRGVDDRLVDAVADADRTGRFVCVLAFADPSGPLGAEVHLEDGAIEGHILREARGAGGFGYDPLFLPIGETRTTAEMPAAEKNAISHRAVASGKMRDFLRGYLSDHPKRR